jgi:hypothetical protein
LSKETQSHSNVKRKYSVCIRGEESSEHYVPGKIILNWESPKKFFPLVSSTLTLLERTKMRNSEVSFNPRSANLMQLRASKVETMARHCEFWLVLFELQISAKWKALRLNYTIRLDYATNYDNCMVQGHFCCLALAQVDNLGMSKEKRDAKYDFHGKCWWPESKYPNFPPRSGSLILLPFSK